MKTALQSDTKSFIIYKDTTDSNHYIVVSAHNSVAGHIFGPYDNVFEAYTIYCKRQGCISLTAARDFIACEYDARRLEGLKGE